MKSKLMFRLSIGVGLLLCALASLPAYAKTPDSIEGHYLGPQGDAVIRVARGKDGIYRGTIVWQAESKKLGHVMMSGFRYRDGKWSKGFVFPPRRKNMKLDASLSQKGANIELHAQKRFFSKRIVLKRLTKEITPAGFVLPQK